MKKLKAILLGFALCMAAPLVAEDFDWSQFWCNYGAGIEKGDMLLSADVGIGWLSFYPTVYVDFEIAQPIWKLPFTFGGYASVRPFGGFGLSVGGSAAYHVMLPPKNLDVYLGLKIGIDILPTIWFTPGFNIGASWYFTDKIGVNLELGYPGTRAGVIFKF